MWCCLCICYVMVPFAVLNRINIFTIYFTKLFLIKYFTYPIATNIINCKLCFTGIWYFGLSTACRPSKAYFGHWGYLCWYSCGRPWKGWKGSWSWCPPWKSSRTQLREWPSKYTAFYFWLLNVNFLKHHSVC